MLNYIPGLMQNPLVIAGLLMALAVVIYFSLEFRHMTHKTKIERATIIIGWGFFLLAAALASLFTSFLHVIANSAGIMPDGLTNELYNLDNADKLCSQLAAGNTLTAEYASGCSVVHYLYYVSYGLLAVALLLLVTGFLKRIKSIKEEKSKPKINKHCTECGIKLPKEAKHCSDCGKKQEATN